MAMGYDGSIRIDTRVNTGNFNTAITSMVKVVKRLGSALLLAFGARTIGNFAKDAVSSASELSSALVGLQSIVEGSGQSFAGAQKFIDDYISDGLVPATNAINAYKNLALRGYNTDQIEKTLEILKNTAVFGRQASLSVGEAVQSATEGLKNENSILVDNAGVTKNVAKMWDTYAKSIGTTARSLTRQQKIQAEVAGLIEESRLQMGDAAKYLDTYAGKVSQLQQAFYNFKVALGNVFIPILEKIIPIITKVINYLTVLANTAAKFIKVFLGIDTSVASSGLEEVASGANAAANAQDNLAEATENAGKAAKGALAPFDELNVLAQETGSTETPGEAVVGGGAPIVDTSETESVFDETIAKMEALKDRLAGLFAPITESLGGLKEALEPLKSFAATGLEDFYNNLLVPIGEWVLGEGLPRFIDAVTNELEKVDWENLNDSLNGLWDSLTPFTLSIGEGLLSFWEDVLVPIGKWAIDKAAPAFADLLSGALDVLTSTIEALKPLGTWLWEEFLQPAGEWAGQALLDALEWLTDRLTDLSTWIENHQTAVQNITTVIGSFAAAWGLVNLAMGIWNVVGVIATGVTGAFGAAVAFLTSPVTLVVLAIGALIAIIVLLVRNWDWVKEKAGAVWDWIVGVWQGAGDWFKTKVLEPIKNAFRIVLDWIGEKWETVFGGVRDFVKGIVNSIIDFINTMIRAVASGINAVIGGLNSINVTIPKWVPGIGGNTWGLSIPAVTAPQIPRLATGAVIPPNSQFAAILGDQRSGYNLEGPEDLFRQIVREELAGMIGGEDITITTPVYLDSEKIYEGQKRVQRRRGKSLVTGGSIA